MEIDPRQLDALALAARDGDREAFHRLVLDQQAGLRAWIAWRAGGDPELVEDVLQETFIAAHRALAGYQARGTLRAWLRGIARNRLHEALRERRRLRETPLDDLDRLVADAREHSLADGSSPAADLERLRVCLDALGSAARRLVELRYRCDLPLTEVARRLGRTAGSVAVSLHRVRRRLLRCLRVEEAG